MEERGRERQHGPGLVRERRGGGGKRERDERNRYMLDRLRSRCTCLVGDMRTHTLTHKACRRARTHTDTSHLSWRRHAPVKPLRTSNNHDHAVCVCVCVCVCVRARARVYVCACTREESHRPANAGRGGICQYHKGMTKKRHAKAKKN